MHAAPRPGRGGSQCGVQLSARAATRRGCRSSRASATCSRWAARAPACFFSCCFCRDHLGRSSGGGILPSPAALPQRFGGWQRAGGCGFSAAVLHAGSFPLPAVCRSCQHGNDCGSVLTRQLQSTLQSVKVRSAAQPLSALRHAATQQYIARRLSAPLAIRLACLACLHAPASCYPKIRAAVICMLRPVHPRWCKWLR